MSLAALWADVRETRRIDAHWKRVHREFVAARRATAPREGLGVRAGFFALGWLLKGTAFALKWGVPALGAWGGVRDGKPASGFVVLVASAYLVAACNMGQSSVPGSVFKVVRFHSRRALLASEMARRLPLLLWWSAMGAVVAWRLGAPPFVFAACAVGPLVVALGGASAAIRKRIDDPALRGRLSPLTFVVLAAVAAPFWGWAEGTGSDLRVAFEAVLFGLVVACGAHSAYAAFRRIGLADVPKNADEPKAERPRRRAKTSMKTARNMPVPSAPEAGLLSAHRGYLAADWASTSTSARLSACAVVAIWLFAAPVGVAVEGPAATEFAFYTILFGAYAALLKNVFAVRHPSRLALYGVTPRALRLYGLGTFLLAVALPTALIAAASLAWLGTPSPLWFRLYGGVAAVFVLRMGWDGFEIMGRAEGAARRWSLPLRLLAVAAFLAIPTAVGALPSAALGLVGLTWLLTHLDLPIWDSAGEDRRS